MSLAQMAWQGWTPWDSRSVPLSGSTACPRKLATALGPCAALAKTVMEGVMRGFIPKLFISPVQSRRLACHCVGCVGICFVCEMFVQMVI